MALKATIYKVTLQIADMDRHYYHAHTLSIAQHPSENIERMMVRLLAFALNASDSLQFTRGLCVAEEPALWQKNLQGDIELWVELGQAEERRLKKACTLAEKVFLYTYQTRSSDIWWQQNRAALERLDNLSIFHLPSEMVTQLAKVVTRNMALQCTIQDGDIWLSDDKTSLNVSLQRWQ